jgi:uncharacterized protein DUF2092
MTSLNPRADIYDPKTLAMMDQVFAAIWNVLRADDPFRDSYNDSELRIATGHKLMDLVADGVTDPRRLRKLTVESLLVLGLKSSGKAMSDYLAAQQAISFAIDSTLEVVTDQDQKLGLASSGTLTLKRPDKLHATRTGGFADVEMVFDGKTLTVLGKNANVFAKAEEPGTIDQGRHGAVQRALLARSYGLLHVSHVMS